MMPLFTRTLLAATLTFAGGTAGVSEVRTPSEPPLRVEHPASAAADRLADKTNPSAKYGAWGFDSSGVDATDRPGDSFFDYVNGAWDKRTSIPADMARFGMFDALRNQSQEQLRAIIAEAASSDAARDSEAGKIGALYNAFMDETRVEP